MTVTITGDSGAYSLTDATSPVATLPTNGNAVDAPVMAAVSQRTLDYVASVAQDVYNKETFGIAKIEAVGSVAALQARTGMADGSVVMLLDPSYVGGAAQRLSGFGLFVFFTGAVWPQTSVPGIADAWLVIQPTDNTGRWLNVIVGVGWELGAGSDPVFMPRVAAQSQQWSATGNVNAPFPYTGIGAGYVGTEIVLNTGLPQAATIALDFDFTLNSPSASSGGMAAVIEVSKGGGAWTIVPGSKKPLGAGASDDIWMPTHLGAFYTAPDNDTYDFRVSLSGDPGQTMNLFRTWSARGLSYLPVLPDRPL